MTRETGPDRGGQVVVRHRDRKSRWYSEETSSRKVPRDDGTPLIGFPYYHRSLRGRVESGVVTGCVGTRCVETRKRVRHRKGTVQERDRRSVRGWVQNPSGRVSWVVSRHRSRFCSVPTGMWSTTAFEKCTQLGNLRVLLWSFFGGKDTGRVPTLLVPGLPSSW